MDEISRGMNLYQDQADLTAQYPGAGVALHHGAAVYNALALAGEAGEVAGKVSKTIRDGNGELTEEFVNDLAAELGDVLWHLSGLALAIGYTLGSVARGNLDKLRSRAERGVIAGSGDNR